MTQWHQDNLAGHPQDQPSNEDPPCERSAAAEETLQGVLKSAVPKMKTSGIRQAGRDQEAARTVWDEQAASALVPNLP